MMQTAEHTSLALPDYALRFMDMLDSAGLEAWFVGGCVRDALLGRSGGDIDIACKAPWEQTKRACNARGVFVHETGIDHGTITAIFDGFPIEVTTYRSDGEYIDNRHPSSVERVETIEEDLARRDFTINAMAWHPNCGLVDPYGGRADLESGTIRAVGVAKKRFEEDALRILRACRLCSQLGFQVENDTLQAMMESKKFLHKVSKERITTELQKLLLGKHVHDAIMSTVDVLSAVLPELVSMKGFDQRTPYHKYDVLEHTAWAVQHSPATPLSRWVALFHDTGKPAAFFTDENGTGHFYGHGNISVFLARGAMERLSLPTQLKEDVLTLVALHDEVIDENARAIKRVMRKLDGRDDLFFALCDMKRADALAQADRCLPRAEHALALKDMLVELRNAKEPFRVKDLAISGRDVMELGIEQGPEVGALLEKLFDDVIEERLPNEREALLSQALELANR